MPVIVGWNERKRNIKKTRQGLGRGSKFGHKKSKRYYIKKYRGQGGSKRRKS